MPEYLTPGVYIEEIEIGAKPIEGVSTSTAAFLGRTERGPLEPRLITSFDQFQRLYGGYLADSCLAYEVDGFFRNGGSRCYLARIAGANEPATSSKTAESSSEPKYSIASMECKSSDGKIIFTVSALGPGASGNKIRISIEIAGLSSLDTKLFKLKASNSDVEEVYDNLSVDAASSDYYVNRVNGISNLIVISPGELITKPDNISEVNMEGGGDTTTTLKDYEGHVIDLQTGKRTGWLALNRISDISIYCEPVEADSALQASLTDSVIAHCENMKDRFAILQTPEGTTSNISSIWPPRDSKYAALYHPWMEVLDPLTNLLRYVPPAGHIAGIYARTDGLRGVHKAPANETVNGIIDLKFDIQKGEQNILNPRGVNCIRAFQGQGIKVWGARTISRDPLWKYVNVRRLFIYLEKSINQGTQWAVFEPNNESLWARVKQTISQFLTTVWRSGALMGTTEEEAFFVKCDRTTMTQDDIDNGRLIVLVGVAPVKPAEFVIFRIAQVANAANATE